MDTRKVHPPQGEQLPNQMVAQQYVVTINGDVTGQFPPVNLRAIGVTATLQLICAALEVALGVLAILSLCVLSLDGLAIWSGLAFFMVAGILGRMAVRKKNNCTIIAYMVLSILSALASSSLVLSILPAIFAEEDYQEFRAFEPPLNLPRCGRMAINSAIVIVGMAEGIIAVVSSAFCCRGTCCAPPRSLQIQYSPAVPDGSVVVPQDGQAISIPQGQRTQTIVINPSPAYRPGAFPDQTTAMLPPPAYAVSAAPPVYQANTTQQPGGTARPQGHDATDNDDGTDQQALVM